MKIPINKDFEEFFCCLNKNGVDYVIVGGYAVMYYSEPIATKDLDIYVDPTEENSKKVYKSICDFFGEKIRDLTEGDFAKPGIIYQIGVSPNRIDIITEMRGVPFHDAWKNRVSAKYGKEPIWIIDRESLIKNKKFLKREQDLWHLKKLKEKK